MQFALEGRTFLNWIVNSVNTKSNTHIHSHQTQKHVSIGTDTVGFFILLQFRVDRCGRQIVVEDHKAQTQHRQYLFQLTSERLY